MANLADLFNDTSFSGLAATGKTVKENPQYAKRMVRAIVRDVLHARDNPEEAVQTMVSTGAWERDMALDACNLVECCNPCPPKERRADGAVAGGRFEREAQAPGARIYGSVTG